MKTVCQVLGVARSHVHALAHRPDDWIDGRKAAGIDPVSDAMLVDAVRA